MATWTPQVSPFDGNGELFNGCWSPELGLFVACGDPSGIAALMSSPDGVNWTERPSDFDAREARAVAWSPSLGLFVAVGWDGGSNSVATSDDGMTWIGRGITGGGEEWYAVAWDEDEGLFVAGGDSQGIITSPDGVNWTDQVSPFDGNGVHGVCRAPELGLWIATSLNGDGTKYVMTSPNATAWTAISTPFDSGGANGVCWSSRLALLFVSGYAASDPEVVMTSPDGTNWTPRTTSLDGGEGLGVFDCGTTVVLVGTTGSDAIAESEDGLLWSADTSQFDSDRANGVFYSPDLGLAVAVGDTDPAIATAPFTPFVPPIVASRRFVGAPWRIIVTSIAGRTLSDLDRRATGRQFLYTLNGPAYHTGQVASDDPEINIPFPDADSPALLTNNRRLLYALRYESSAVTVPSKVLKSDGGALDAAWAQKDLGVTESEVWVTFDAALTTAALAAFVSQGGSPQFLVLSLDGSPFDFECDELYGDVSGSDLIWGDLAGTGGVVAAEVWQTIELHYVNGTTMQVYVDGVLLIDDASVTSNDAGFITLGLQTATDAGEVWYFRNVKVGTTRGASDLFADDFASGDLSAWTSTFGDVSVVDDPFGAVAVVPPPYVCRFGGIITNFEDQGADAPTSRYTAYDPWQLLMSRPIRGPGTDLALPGEGGITFPAGTRASDIAGFFLEATELVDGETHIDTTDGSLIEDTDPLTEPITFDAGLSVGEAWQQLVATGTIDIYLPPMYEPIDAPGKVVRFQTAKRLGETRFNVVMGWDKAGRSLQGVNRLIDGTRMANRVKYWAGSTPAPLESDAASIAAYGEWWAQQFFPGEANIGLVDLMALAELQIRKNGARSINLDPAPERTELVLRDWGLGDYLPVWASRNLREPLGIDYDAFDPDFPGASGYHRVFAIPVELDDNGVELTRGVATAAENASA